jgi:hypothetical protein
LTTKSPQKRNDQTNVQIFSGPQGLNSLSMFKVTDQDYRISSELEQEQFQDCELEMVWCAKESQVQAENQHQIWPHNHIV